MPLFSQICSKSHDSPLIYITDTETPLATPRSDMVHPVGKLTAKDFVSVLPYIAATAVLECTGSQVIMALENGVSQWPKLEGRFPQVSGLKFKFDPSKPPGQRVLPGSVFATAIGPEPEPFSDERKYKVAVTEYLASGRDGFDVFLVNARAYLRA